MGPRIKVGFKKNSVHFDHSALWKQCRRKKSRSYFFLLTPSELMLSLRGTLRKANSSLWRNWKSGHIHDEEKRAGPGWYSQRSAETCVQVQGRLPTKCVQRIFDNGQFGEIMVLAKFLSMVIDAKMNIIEQICYTVKPKARIYVCYSVGTVSG